MTVPIGELYPACAQKGANSGHPRCGAPAAQPRPAGPEQVLQNARACNRHRQSVANILAIVVDPQRRLLVTRAALTGAAWRAGLPSDVPARPPAPLARRA